MQAVKRFCFCNVYSRNELISTWKTFHWGTSGGAGTGEWIEKSAKFKINDINYREFVEKRETLMLSIAECVVPGGNSRKEFMFQLQNGFSLKSTFYGVKFWINEVKLFRNKFKQF